MYAAGVITSTENRSSLRFFQFILLFSLGIFSNISLALELAPLKPYAGIEYVHRSLIFKEGFGKGNFNKSIPQGNVTLGIQINDYVGLEAGYLFSQAVTRTSYSTAGQIFGGIILNPTLGQFIVSENKINLTGPHVNVIGRIPFGMSGFSGIGLLGLTWLDLKAQIKVLGSEAVPVFTPDIIERRMRHFSSKKIIPKLMFGLGYQFTDFIGIRALMGYEMTNRFRDIGPKEQGALKITLKNNILFSVGLTAHF